MLNINKTDYNSHIERREKRRKLCYKTSELIFHAEQKNSLLSSFSARYPALSTSLVFHSHSSNSNRILMVILLQMKEQWAGSITRTTDAIILQNTVVLMISVSLYSLLVMIGGIRKCKLQSVGFCQEYTDVFISPVYCGQIL